MRRWITRVASSSYLRSYKTIGSTNLVFQKNKVTSGMLIVQRMIRSQVKDGR